jgi:hypothetical protein
MKTVFSFCTQSFFGKSFAVINIYRLKFQTCKETHAKSSILLAEISQMGIMPTYFGYIQHVFFIEFQSAGFQLNLNHEITLTNVVFK